MFDATFDNITVIMMRLVLLEEEIVESRESIEFCGFVMTLKTRETSY
jgi:hypothetical protein